MDNESVLTFNWRRLNVGDVIVFKLNGKAYLKRIDSIDNDSVRVSGDNKKLSTKFDQIYKSTIVGVVIWKY